MWTLAMRALMVLAVMLAALAASQQSFKPLPTSPIPAVNVP
jgi:hypothetical protein